MLERILRAIKNYYIREVWSGDFLINNGALAGVGFLKNGQWFKIEGSMLNDGVYQYPATDLDDEEFSGEVWALAVPKEIVTLSQEVDAWLAANADVIKSPYMSESFGGYSYSKASGGTNASGKTTALTWESVFADRLNQWRKARYEFTGIRYDYVRPAE